MIAGFPAKRPMPPLRDFWTEQPRSASRAKRAEIIGCRQVSIERTRGTGRVKAGGGAGRGSRVPAASGAVCEGRGRHERRRRTLLPSDEDKIELLRRDGLRALLALRGN